MSSDMDLPVPFHGTVRLFPLPNVVFFPHVLLPLHIFEARYRQMTADALAGDRLIAMALLQPGWEASYEGRPALYSIACLGKIIGEQQLEDGRYNIMLRGLRRLRIVRERESGKLYRTADVDLLEDQGITDLETARRLRRQLHQQVARWFQALGLPANQVEDLVQSDLTLGVLGDVLGFALPLDIPLKQQLLEDLDVERRTRRLLEVLEANDPKPPPAEPRQFPPRFSTN